MCKVARQCSSESHRETEGDEPVQTWQRLVTEAPLQLISYQFKNDFSVRDLKIDLTNLSQDYRTWYYFIQLLKGQSKTSF